MGLESFLLSYVTQVGVILYVIMRLEGVNCVLESRSNSSANETTSYMEIIPDLNLFLLEREHVKEAFLREGMKSKYSTKTLLRLFFWLEGVENDVLRGELKQLKPIRKYLRKEPKWCKITDQIHELQMKVFLERKNFLEEATSKRRNMVTLRQLNMDIHMMQDKIELLKKKKMEFENKWRDYLKDAGSEEG